MNIFKSNLSVLEKENDNKMEKISEQNKNTVRDIVRYLSSSSLSLFEIQVIRKDLIGMALQSDLEHSTLRDKIGINEKDFCDAIIENGHNHRWMEHLIRFIVSFFQAYAIFYCIDFILLNSSPAIYGIKVINLIFMFLWGIFGITLTMFIRNKLSVSSIHYKSIFVVIPVILAISSMKWLNTVRIAELYILKGNGWFIGCTILIIAITFTILENAFWNISSEKYSWKDGTSTLS